MCHITNKLSISLAPGLVFSNNAVQPLTSVDQNGILTTTYENISKMRRVQLTSQITYQPSKKFSFSVSGSAQNNLYEFGGSNNSYWNTNSTLRISANELWKGGMLLATMQYQPFGRDVDNYRNHYSILYSFGLTQKFFKNFSAMVFVENPWDRYLNHITETRNESLYRYSESSKVGRQISVSLSYTFGRFRDGVRSTRRQVSSDSDRRQGE